MRIFETRMGSSWTRFKEATAAKTGDAYRSLRDFARGQPPGRDRQVAAVASVALLVAALSAQVMLSGESSSADERAYPEFGAAAWPPEDIAAPPTPAPSPPPVVAPPPPPPPAPTPVPPPLLESHWMIIDRIGVNAPTATYGLDANQVPIVPTGAGAAYVVAWYNFSAPPGTGGNTVYAGHVTWNGAAVFYNLDALVPGDIIRLRDDRGAEVVYQVTTSVSMAANDPTAVQLLHPADHDMITIVTCGGSFYSTGDPTFGGDYTSRTIVRADLVSVTRV